MIERWICNRCDLAWFTEDDAKSHAQNEDHRSCAGGTYSRATVDRFISGYVPIPDAPPIKLLLKDGKEIMRGTEVQIWKYIHDNHCFSVSHALAHEGYSIEEDQR